MLSACEREAPPVAFHADGYPSKLSEWHVVYRDGDKSYHLAGPLPHGAKATMKSGGLAAGNMVPTDLLLTSRFVHLVENQPGGSYLAVLERSPFWDPGVASIVERGSFHLVIGWPEGQP